jgi:hypothetical protein
MIFFLLKLKFLEEQVNKILEIFKVSLLIEVVAEVVVKVDVVEILINKIFEVIFPIVMHSQEEVGISIK